MSKFNSLLNRLRKLETGEGDAQISRLVKLMRLEAMADET